jgi:outer membrane receptor for ferric coprogen and ferric-rhodotorulic acid
MKSISPIQNRPRRNAQSRTSGSGGISIKQGGFALLGLMAKYQISQQAEVRITANNVFDRKYRYPDTVLGTHYGEPRSVFASVKYAF